ncbi:hypothetical protein IKA15_05365 [bacterium]|nr:hypothetical protein [bacterium]
MYIFELIAKLRNKKKKNESQQEVPEEALEEENCSHNFAPLDSTKKYFACTKCGLVVEGKNLKDINFFKS